MAAATDAGRDAAEVEQEAALDVAVQDLGGQSADVADAPDTADATDAPDAADVTDAPDATEVNDATDVADAAEVTCAIGESLCGGRCVATAVDVMHCGRCGNACRAPNAEAACAAGACRVGSCATGFADCDADAANGCEVDVRASALHCGGCAMPCASPLNGSARCGEGRCVTTCNAGFVIAGGACAGLPAPRQIAPLSTATATTRSPTLRWQLAVGTDGARVEICRERDCSAIERRMDVMGSSAALSPALAPGVWFWRLQGVSGGAAGFDYGPVWQFNIDARPRNAADSSWGSTTDLNGDGYADLVVARHAQVDVYYGAASGLTSSPTTLTLPRDAIPTVAGDTNGDGFVDLAVGIVGGRSGLPDQVRFFAGSVGGVSIMPLASRDGELYVAALGDVDLDGYGDIRGQASVVPGSPRGPLGGTSYMASSGDEIFPVGDVNGDGPADFVLGGLTGASLFQGRAGLRALGSGFSVASGVSASALGDVNGDGYDDFAVALSSGAEVYRGAASSPVRIATSVDAPVPIRDVNADGYADALFVTDTSVEVRYGAAAGPLSSRRAVLGPGGRAIAPGDVAWVAAPGDINRDGFADFAITVADDVYVYDGRSFATMNVPVRVLAGVGGRLALAAAGARNDRRVA